MSSESADSAGRERPSVRGRLSREWDLWLAFAPEAVASVGYLLALWSLTLVGVLGWQVGAAGTALWLLAAAVWVAVGRRSDGEPPDPWRRRDR